MRENKEVSLEFMNFINNLWMYIEYDTNTSFLFAKTRDDASAQDKIHEKISSVRKEILTYLFEKNLVSNEVFQSQLDYEVKTLVD